MVEVGEVGEVEGVVEEVHGGIQETCTFTFRFSLTLNCIPLIQQ